MPGRQSGKGLGRCRESSFPGTSVCLCPDIFSRLLAIIRVLSEPLILHYCFLRRGRRAWRCVRSPDETASAWQKRSAHSFGVASGPVDVVCEALCFMGIRVWPPSNRYGQLEGGKKKSLHPTGCMGLRMSWGCPKLKSRSWYPRGGCECHCARQCARYRNPHTQTPFVLLSAGGGSSGLSFVTRFLCRQVIAAGWEHTPRGR